eukprot:CAMPEP_0194305992 /NCGR_PEP_ID=MMETSP0171-20130528/3284_1 /TAXON_ID=218684 /ORGANISM="Corethron pennatum, Strain L29A3" /LENGTH=225 /DNA_ID=CAMNT_0039057667 /DNA_START=86 /DNA_END=763 /DNA_ORIENTATION=+
MIKTQQVSDKVGSVSVVNSGADDLLAKIRALSKINAELLERIASRMKAQVIIRYDYSVTLNYCAGATDPVQISIAEVTESARVRVNSWKYTGEPLDRVWVCCGPSDRENINRKKLWKYSDINKVNKNLLKLSERFASIAGDNEKVRDILRGYLNNFEKIQVAIGQVEELTIDAVDDFNQNELQNNLKAVVSTMKLFPREHRFTLTPTERPIIEDAEDRPSVFTVK